MTSKWPLVRSRGGYNYPDYAATPAGSGDHKVAVDEDDDHADYLYYKLESDGSLLLTDEEHDTVKAVANLSTALPTLDGGAGSAGAADDKTMSKGTHQHGATPITVLSKRYYLTNVTSDRLVSPYNGYLLSLTNPTDEANAYDLPPPSGETIAETWLDSPSGEPGLALWPSGIVNAHIRARIRNVHEHMTYTLYFKPWGSQTTLLTRVPLPLDNQAGWVYQAAPFPDTEDLTSTYQTFDVPVYVTELNYDSTDRLRVRFWVAVTGGTLTDEIFELRCGGDNASYLEVLFTDSAGGSVNHQTTTHRGTFLVAGDETKYGHPQAFIEPGRVHSPCGIQITTADGLFTMPNSNTVRLGGAEPLLGINREDSGTDPWKAGDKILIINNDVTRIVQGSGTVPSTHNAIYLGPQFVDPANPAGSFQLSFPFLSTLQLVFNGVDWLLAAQPTFG